METSSKMNLDIPEFLPRTPRKGRNLEIVGEHEVEPKPEPAPAQNYSQWEARLKAKEAELTKALVFLTTAVKIVSNKSLCYLTAVVSAGLFSYAIANPSAMTTGAACLFAVIVFLPSLYAANKE